MNSCLKPTLLKPEKWYPYREFACPLSKTHKSFNNWFCKCDRGLTFLPQISQCIARNTNFCPKSPSDPRGIFEGCFERFAWFAPKSDGCLKQNAFRKSLFFQKRGMSRAKSLFYKPILTLNGKRGKNKKKMRHCDRLECCLYFMHQMRNVFAAVCGCL